ncbi:hypothetical protein JCGZ_26749 [Jatropha curcas]|uniref:CRM domain-containing protein n=1 Tax=Jatropha curcas TaxID=180498 RepID=A0A067KZX9_JATCU|nr:uncharacterized protein LOC105630102 [Jatropha curcas]KDP41731.1 hypothetical protein JCGZ_26749 [Jatropha curcas]
MAVASSSVHVLHRLLRPPPPQPPVLPFVTPLPTATTCAIAASISRKSILLSKYSKSRPHYTTVKTILSFLYPLSTTAAYSLLLPHSLSTSSPNKSHSLEEDEDDDGEIEYAKEDIDTRIESLEVGDANVVINTSDGSSKEGLSRSGLKVPNLTVKEKKELASYAHGLGKKLKCQLVGKSGVTDNVVSSFIETLEANELLKIKIHRSCPGELEDVVQKLEAGTGSVVVGQIGRTVIIYRPSLSKLEAEEKKLRARRVFVRKDSKLNPVSLPTRVQVPRLSGRGRRGRSRTERTQN